MTSPESWRELATNAVALQHPGMNVESSAGPFLLSAGAAVDLFGLNLTSYPARSATPSSTPPRTGSTERQARPRTSIFAIVVRFHPIGAYWPNTPLRQRVDNTDKQAHGGDTGPWRVSMNKDQEVDATGAWGIEFLTCQSGDQDRPRAVVPLRRGRFPIPGSGASGAPDVLRTPASCWPFGPLQPKRRCWPNPPIRQDFIPPTSTWTYRGVCGRCRSHAGCCGIPSPREP